MPGMKDITGQHFGRWTALDPDRTDRHGNRRWRCLCDCGTQKVVSGHNLRSGETLSCGCLQLENCTTHGQKGSRTYECWNGMIQRCTNPKKKHYKYYGGRGIAVCERWRKFANFFDDMGERPVGMSLDRYPDNDGNYEPGNCRWATAKEQRHNQGRFKPGPTQRDTPQGKPRQRSRPPKRSIGKGQHAGEPAT